MMRTGIDPARLWAQPQDWTGFPALLDDWIEKAAGQIARAALTVCAVIDFEAVLIDGGFPASVRTRLVDRARAVVGALDARGLIPPRIEGGVIGGNVRALSAASGPVFAQFFLNTHAGRPA